MKSRAERYQGKKFIEFILIALFMILSKIFFWKAKQRIWLIACGGERWGDNADAFWRYMNNQHPEIKTIAIMKNNECVDAPEGEWVKRKSIMSYVMILQAEAMVVTHALSDVGPEFIVSKSKAGRVWLQHGVIGIKKILAAHAVSGHYDIVCASSAKEKEIMTDELGVNPDIIAVTGLARHDILKEKAGKNLDRVGILYIPTSRVWLDQNQKEEYEAMLFSWVEKLNDGKTNMTIKTWLHPGWYKSGLDDLGLNYNKVEHYQINKDPQKLILESRLLITDYSSIFFDAALSGIPTIFFQPDRASYLENKGLFKDFLEQDLLLILDNQEELLKQVEAIMKYTDYYKQRLKKDQEWAYQYVETYDGKSCRRIYEHIEKMLK